MMEIYARIIYEEEAKKNLFKKKNNKTYKNK